VDIPSENSTKHGKRRNRISRDSLYTSDDWRKLWTNLSKLNESAPSHLSRGAKSSGSDEAVCQVSAEQELDRF
jgi:hypothetical protein